MLLGGLIAWVSLVWLRALIILSASRSKIPGPGGFAVSRVFNVLYRYPSSVIRCLAIGTFTPAIAFAFPQRKRYNINTVSIQECVGE